MNDRGMKKWMPYKSLNEQEKFINELNRSINKIEKPIVSIDKANDINNFLINYKNEVVCLKFYSDGYISKLIGRIKKIDPIYKTIKINNTLIKFSMIVDLNFYI